MAAEKNPPDAKGNWVLWYDIVGAKQTIPCGQDQDCGKNSRRHFSKKVLLSGEITRMMLPLSA